jgi:hypothetical protein
MIYEVYQENFKQQFCPDCEILFTDPEFDVINFLSINKFNKFIQL